MGQTPSGIEPVPGLGQEGLYIGWDRMGLGQGGVQISWDRMGLGQVSFDGTGTGLF